MQEVQETRVQSLIREDPLEEMANTPVFLPGESRGQRSLAGYSPWSLKESDMTKQVILTHPGGLNAITRVLFKKEYFFPFFP